MASSFLKPLVSVLPATALLISLISSLPQPTAAQTYQPPLTIGLPGRREGGGTRGGCADARPSLTAVMPADSFGYTTEAYPTWYFYVPNISAQTAEFTIYDEAETALYQSTLALEGNAGIISLSLPRHADLRPLQVGQSYRWEFALICNPNTPSGVVFVDGWVERIEPSTALQSQLMDATPLEQARLYAEAGIWYNAIDILGQLRRANSDQSRYQSSWQQLLDSVGLRAIASKPFQTCCSAEPDASAEANHTSTPGNLLQPSSSASPNPPETPSPSRRQNTGPSRFRQR
jgi:hypothetical protein